MYHQVVTAAMSILGGKNWPSTPEDRDGSHPVIWEAVFEHEITEEELEDSWVPRFAAAVGWMLVRVDGTTDNEAASVV